MALDHQHRNGKQVCEKERGNAGLLAAEIRWMAAYSPHLDFSLALHHEEQDHKAIRRSQDEGAGE